MRLYVTLLATFLFVTLSQSSRAATLKTFVIVSSADPQVPHGTLDNGDAYSGTFTFDTSLIPTTGSFSISIPTFDFITYIPGGSIEAAPAFTDFATLSGTPMLIGGHALSYDVLSIDYGFIELDLVEPLGAFPGGDILYAYQADAGSGSTDTKGTALLVDPAILAPEPGTILPMAAGLLAFCGIGIGRRVSRSAGPGRRLLPA
jgi:hypothetical protein